MKNMLQHSKVHAKTDLKNFMDGASFGKDGGYIMCTSNHFFHAPKRNLLAYAKAARECVY